MKKINLFFILVCTITVLFSSCDREMNYLKVDEYYIVNATDTSLPSFVQREEAFAESFCRDRKGYHRCVILNTHFKL